MQPYMQKRYNGLLGTNKSGTMIGAATTVAEKHADFKNYLFRLEDAHPERKDLSNISNLLHFFDQKKSQQPEMPKHGSLG